MLERARREEGIGDNVGEARRMQKVEIELQLSSVRTWKLLADRDE